MLQRTLSLEMLPLFVVADYFVNHGDPVTVNNDESAIRMAGYEAIWRADMSGVNIAYTQLLYQSQHTQHNNHPTGGPNKDVLY